MEPEDGGSGAVKVVISEGGQCSIWPAGRPNPPGWRDGGKSGSRAECLAYIGEVWVELLPLGPPAGSERSTA